MGAIERSEDGLSAAAGAQLDLTTGAKSAALRRRAGLLRDRGCLRYQGPLFSLPVVSDCFEPLLGSTGGAHEDKHA